MSVLWREVKSRVRDNPLAACSMLVLGGLLLTAPSVLFDASITWAMIGVSIWVLGVLLGLAVLAVAAGIDVLRWCRCRVGRHAWEPLYVDDGPGRPLRIAGRRCEHCAVKEQHS